MTFSFPTYGAPSVTPGGPRCSPGRVTRRPPRVWPWSRWTADVPG